MIHAHIAVRKTLLTFKKLRAHSPTFPSLHLRHNSFSNPSVALSTSQPILQPFRCFSYVTSSFSNPSFASPTSLALHLIHLASRPCPGVRDKREGVPQSDADLHMGVFTFTDTDTGTISAQYRYRHHIGRIFAHTTTRHM